MAAIGGRMEITLRAIATVRGGRRQRIDDDWDSVTAEIHLDEEWIPADALVGIDSFSHVEILFRFDRLDPSDVVTGMRHPRDRRDWPAVGILAQRGSVRPNLMGITVCRVLRLEGPVLTVRGLDALDGTPVFDIKPYMTGFAPRATVREPAWAQEIMARYWK